MTEPLERELDKALRTGEGATDPRLTELVRQADTVEAELAREAPSGGRERALFIEGVGLRRRHLPGLKVLAPAAVVVAALLAIAGFSRSALPGDTLYPVREVLASVGLAAPTTEEAARRVDSAERDLDLAALNMEVDPVQSRNLTLAAIADLQRARNLLEEEDGERADELLDRVDALESRAVSIIERLQERKERAEQADDRREDRREDDNSGPGSGNDNSGPGSDGDDNSGPGSGGDDNSGPGSGDDDNSGPGSDGDDNSGPGSDGDDGGDNSGSGSDSSGSGSGSGDGSGSGSGDDTSGSGSGGDSSGPGSGDDLATSGEDASGSGGDG